MKTDKGNGIVLLAIKDYSNSVEHLLKSLQSYLRTLLKRNEIIKAEFDMMRPKNAKPTRAHGLPPWLSC